jgi:hypothetical protein
MQYNPAFYSSEETTEAEQEAEQEAVSRKSSSLF